MLNIVNIHGDCIDRLKANGSSLNRNQYYHNSLCRFIILSYLCSMIFYFSGTGNTKWAAKTIAGITGEHLVSIPDEIAGECRYGLAEGERIGFCFPVHGWQPPAIVRKFVSKCKFSDAAGHYCFALCTCGDNIGLTMEMLGTDLSRVGLRLDSVFSLTMPNTYVCLPFMDTDSKELETAKKEGARKAIDVIAKAISMRKGGICSTVKGPVPYILSNVIGEFFNHQMITDKPFRVDMKLCVACGRCASACPTGNIAPDAGNRPQWLHGGLCTGCMACYHHCPTHAINYGRATRHKGQYYYGRNND